MSTRQGWRYFAMRVNGDGTEEMIHPDLPLQDVEIEDVLSGHGGLSAQIEPVFKSLLADDGERILTEYGTAIFAENGGDIRGGGLLVNSDIDGPALALECVGYSGYPIDLPYTGAGYMGVEVDPLDVARLIWSHIQSQPGGNLGLTFDQIKSGQKIGTELRQVEFDTQSGPVSFEAGPYKLNWYTNHDLAGDFDALAEDTPFDYHNRTFWSGDTLRHHVDIGYPKIGRRRDDLSFRYGVNIFDPVQMTANGELYASGALVLGAGEGAKMVHSIREPVYRRGRLRRVAVVVDDTIKSQKRADQRADAEIQWRSRIDDIESVVVMDHANAPLGAAQVGDEILLEGRGDWDNVEMWVRILGITSRPGDDQSAEYTVARTDKLL